MQPSNEVGATLSFLDDVVRARALLAETGRVSARALRRQFELDDDGLEEMIEELVDVQQVARREGNVLVWVGAEAPTSPARAATHSGPGPPEPRPADPPETAPAPSSGERRQITVLFCDLVDSTHLSSALDPEDWREVVRSYQQAAGATITRFGGHVAQYLGDGILAYFGHPVAHEDDAERAVRAGLAIVQGIDAMNDGLPRAADDITLQVRIGVHTGPVVVGEMGSAGSAQVLALGETTNLAARLQDQARPDTVVMSGQTRRLVQGIFITYDRGEHELKGIAEPVRVLEVERVSGVRSLIDAEIGEITPLVGRQQELGLLEDRFAQAVDGLGQAVVVNGEAGIGKSRLVRAFREQLLDRPHSWLECRCSPYTQDSALHPILDLHRGAMRFRAEDPAELQTQALEAGLRASGFETPANLPLVLAMHGLPLPEGIAPLELSPEGRRMKTMALLIEWVLRLSRAQPLVMLVEDLHWIDPSSLEFFTNLLDQIPGAPVLVVCTHRPDFAVPWAPKSHVTPLQLARLTRAQLADLVRKSAKGSGLPEAWLDEIVRRSDGVPLFAEELTRTVTETRVEIAPSGEVPTLHIPETLQDSLMARLDALGPVKELAQLCAVLGREFDYPLLLQVSPLKEEALQAALQVAIREELFYQRGTPPEASYHFRHALIRDAAYQSLLRSQRQRYHLHIANTMRERAPAIVEHQPELVARHLTEGGDAEQALPMWRAAGRLAAEHSSYAEAEAHLRAAIALLPELSSVAPTLEIELYNELGSSILAVHGYGSEEMRATVRRLMELVDTCEESIATANALSRAASYENSRGDLAKALELAQRIQASAERLGNEASFELSLANQTPALFYMGRFVEILELHRQFRPFDLDEERRRSPLEIGASAHLFGKSYAAWALWCLGRPAEAMALAEEIVARARELGHPHTLAAVTALAALLRSFLRQFDACVALAEESLHVARENGFALWQGAAGAAVAHARTMLGEPQLDAFTEAMQGSAATGNRAGINLFLWAAAEVQRAAGNPDAALGLLSLALEQAMPMGMLGWHTELFRLRGEIQATEKADPNAAEASFREALEYARGQQARSLELRAATSYGRLLHEQGRTEEARALLAPVYAWFTEGHDLPDLVDAKALLDSLGA
jgi:class 3 adenylate cyclase/tetratricopeptide (TPR) repeat protein